MLLEFFGGAVFIFEGKVRLSGFVQQSNPGIVIAASLGKVLTGTIK